MKIIEKVKFFLRQLIIIIAKINLILKRYEDSLKENLTEKIIENLLLYLQSISVNKSNASLKGNIGYTVKK